MNIEPIGIVHSPAKKPVDENWGSVTSEIRLNDGLAQGLQGLDEFSHAIIIFLMHETSFDPNADMIRRPQGREDMPLTGFFAQRARHRPNPIGVTAIEIVNVDGGKLTVRGLDAIDGTPVLDIKPYFPVFDRVQNPTIPEWVNRLMERYF